MNRTFLRASRGTFPIAALGILLLIVFHLSNHPLLSSKESTPLIYKQDVRSNAFLHIASFFRQSADLVDEEDLDADQPGVFYDWFSLLNSGFDLEPQSDPETNSAVSSHENHHYRGDGLVEVNLSAPHPIYELLGRAEKHWRRKLDNASKTLEDAVKEYHKRYHRPPPVGFDKWWDYVQSNNVQLPDEYDQIYHDIEPFWGFEPADLQARQRDWENHDGSYTLAHENGKIALVRNTLPEGFEASNAAIRAEDQMTLLRDVLQWLPSFRATFTAHDGPAQFIGHDLRSEAVERAAAGEYVDRGRTFNHLDRGWGYACADSSAIWAPNATVLVNMTERWEQPKTFIWDHKRAMDPCLHPSHLHLTGFLESYAEGPYPEETMVPTFGMCTTLLHSDILTVALERWIDDVDDDPEWSDKTDDRLYWRGSNTGMEFNGLNPWEYTQRIRLMRAVDERDGYLNVLRPAGGPDEPVGPLIQVQKSAANPAYMDIAFAGDPVQCISPFCEKLVELFNFGERQPEEMAWKHKYILDVDGNGWSARFKSLMTSRSMVFKSTVFPEWYADRVQPWFHYVPIKNDLTDLYDVISFFRGDTEGGGGHDMLAEKIGLQGREWSRNFWRKEDMVAYQFRQVFFHKR
ncbi:Glycosyltransferase Family 90 domain containing protein [Tulasnella sp. 419]|nr:Glycosyltransferase Family 90 domain containing protein [Tulasnella sp. 419]